MENKFKALFEKGHSPSTALSIFKDNLSEEHGEKYYEVVADGQLCPTQKWVYDLYYSIFKKEYGEPTGFEMVSSLQKFVNEYNEKNGDICAAINKEEDSLSVAICSPVMKRVHKYIKASSEIIFVDSSGNMDRHNTRVFLFLCPSCVGALPLGILFLYSESEASITSGISLLKSILPKQSFYGLGFPKVIITDDCEAERNSLQKSFSCSKLLLCKFHVLQAVMRYLWDSKNGISKNDRVSIYMIFRKTLNCFEVEEFVEEFDSLLKLKSVLSNRKVLRYFQNLKSTANNWAMCYRKTFITRGNETNNYCEATFRVLKDQILQRTKAFSIVQLFDYVTTSFEHYYLKKILDIINGRWEGSKKKNKYYVDKKRIDGLECTKVDCNLYNVRSKEKEYIVNYELECCTCYVGKVGAPCKHQLAVVQKFALPSQQFHPLLLDSSLKKLLHKVITGENCTLEGWYEDFREFNRNNVDQVKASFEQKTEFAEIQTNSANSEQICDEDLSEIKITNSNTFRSELNDIVNNIMVKYENNNKEYEKPISQFIKNFNSCKTDSSLISALHTFGKYCGAGEPLIKRGKNTQGGNTIGVQPTALSRRKTKLGGRKALQSGRPPKRLRLTDHCYSKAVDVQKTLGISETNKKLAAPHSLQHCIDMNKSLGKTHSKK